MSSTAFIEPLPVIEFIAKVLNKDVVARPLSDADRIKVLTSASHNSSDILFETKEILSYLTCYYRGLYVVLVACH